ncbi:hypothetical protein NM688_g6327 [Phlebia brevispora]|uniref:Uncharacterized protein n=1 Tax=Phlebia brevispora TaxID=194682 RepID=A0ACC1SH54_9APHY|nr:hypothetical protein NM688_g6327 [Phlebia brevispora]
MMATTASPWPDVITRSFLIAGLSSATSEKSFYGSWNRLLNTLFPPNTPFEVVPQVPPVTSREAIDFVVLFLIYVEATPVFIVVIRPPSDFRLPSKRQKADCQLRQCFLDIAYDLKIPVLHGVSAFGTKIALYSYHRDTKHLEPRGFTPDPDMMTDTAPREWWKYDILENEGAQRFREVVNDVKSMCETVSF